MSDVVFLTLKSHFMTLELDDYYRNDAVETMGEQRNNYYAYHREQGAEGVAKYLRREERSIRAWRNTVNRNHWRPVLLSALAASQDFCNGGFMRLGPELPLD